MTSEAAGQPIDLAPLANAWRAANDHVQELEREEAGSADSVQIEPLPQSLAKLGEAVLADPRFKRTYGVIPADVGWIELDRLVVFQKHINLHFVSSIHARIGANPSPEAIFRLCLPVDQAPPRTVVERVGDAFVAVSPSSDLRSWMPSGFPLTR